MSSSEGRDSRVAPDPETGGAAHGSPGRRHSPRPVSGSNAPVESGLDGESSAPSRAEEADDGVPSAPVEGPTPPAPSDQPALEAEADEGPRQDLEELTARAEKADEYLELAQRTKADFENYRRRAARDAALAQERGVARLAKELLPAVDNLDRALSAAQEHRNGDEIVSGIELVHADVIAALARVGIEPFSPEGEKFDPTYHEAIAQQPVEGAEPGTVVEVYQRGYRLGENVLRPARVVVAG
jgi:molecular chaperone GrpE